VAAADPTYNFTPYDLNGDCYVDAINIIHQGEGEEASGNSSDILSHSYDLNSAYLYGISNGGEYTTNDACPSGGFIKVNAYVIQPETLLGNQQTVGVFTHEYGHTLGLPDLYDGTYASEGVGIWSLMGGGCWNSLVQAGDTPAYLDAWSKSKLGWVSPSNVIKNNVTLVREAELYPDVYQLLENAGGVNDWTPGGTGSGEYFLLENRQKAGFDAALPGEGLLIWHVDESVGNNANYLHKLVDLEEADGRSDLDSRSNRGDASDPWYNSIAGFTSNSNPNSKMSNGTPSGAGVTNIGSSSPVMEAFLKVPGGGPDISGISPSTGDNTGDSLITDVSGTGFAYGAAVLLTRSGYPSISATKVNVVTSSRITCTFPLNGKTSGQYNLVVINPDGTEGILPSGFTITSPITVTSPNGGENWTRGTSRTVTWSYIGSQGSSVKLTLLKAGIEVGTINSNVPIGVNGTGSYVWLMSASGLTGNDFRVKIQSTSKPATNDMSDGNFTILPKPQTPSLTVTSPNGGENWTLGTSRTVTWSYVGSPGSSVKILLLKAGVEVAAINSGTPVGTNGAGSYLWTVNASGLTGNNFRVKIQSVSQPAINDTGNNNFTIGTPSTTPSITVTSPNGGENWIRGTFQTVTWNYTGSPGSSVKLVLLKAGNEVGTINGSVPVGVSGTGSYVWPMSVNGMTGNDFRVRIMSISLPSINDTSNNNFTIGPRVLL
jgi:M6 family metalloprotease-like protein